ncbi:MAG: hypothetical protein ACI39Q_09690 [Wujia sp.]
MLGKCIKYEVVNRWRQVVSILSGLLIFSVIVLGMTKLDEHVIDNRYYSAFTAIVIGIYVFAYFAVIIGLLLLPCADFSKRFFKDQGYLTHTLPVKSSTLITGRMICDVCMVLVMAIVYPIALSVATWDWSFFEEIIDNVTNYLHWAGSSVDRVMVLGVFVASVIAVFLGVLFSLWQINTAYTFGHIFNQGKRILSVVGYFALWVIFGLVMMLLNKICEIDAVQDFLVRQLGDIETSVGASLLVISIVDVGMLIGVVLLAIATSYMCKHHLNLE